MYRTYGSRAATGSVTASLFDYTFPRLNPWRKYRTYGSRAATGSVTASLFGYTFPRLNPWRKVGPCPYQNECYNSTSISGDCLVQDRATPLKAKEEQHLLPGLRPGFIRVKAEPHCVFYEAH
ncbi:unnamed protein product [Strongylus vulgaris]|uniref:Uncharacterized protein n=1 Tax=Strongylus vulgaris TaxID=40348 RepID=A0A3P7LSK1_STRVU|nr:unnamed protein product [Strongylus vulgaris]